MNTEVDLGSGEEAPAVDTMVPFEPITITDIDNSFDDDEEGKC